MSIMHLSGPRPTFVRVSFIFLLTLSTTCAAKCDQYNNTLDAQRWEPLTVCLSVIDSLSQTIDHDGLLLQFFVQHPSLLA